MPSARALWLAAALPLLAADPALELKPPRYTRDQMESALREDERWLIVYGTRDPESSAALRQRALSIARRLSGADTTAVLADREVGRERLSQGPVFLLGGSRENDWTRRLEGALPVRFTPRGFRWFDREYDRRGDVIQLAYPNPLAPRYFLLLLAANSGAALARRGGGFFLGGEDWRIERDGERLRSGSFSQSVARPWSYDPALDRDLARERERFEAGLSSEGRGGLVIQAPAGLPAARGARARAEALLERMGRMGLAPRPPATVSLTLYRSLEEKGRIARNTRPEHLDARGSPHAALPAGRRELDLWSVAAALLRRGGATSNSRLLEPAAVWLAGRFDGEPLEQAVRRLYFGRLLPTAREAATVGDGWRSPLIWIPARALLVRAVFDRARARGPAAVLALLRADPPASLDSLCRVAGIDPGGVERSYATLADSLARTPARTPGAAAPRPWRAADGFQRGACLAHAVDLERGYLSESANRQLAQLKRLGVDWVSLTPFGYLPSLRTPEIYPSSDSGVDGESDEAICEAAARSRALGIRVWLKPHLWTRGWTGELEFGPSGWPRFFEQYRAFMIHYALLAEREGVDGLVVGHELPSASVPFPERWRVLIADIRRVYHGTLAYDAHWQDEAGAITFWDALDVVGVSFYAPLSPRATTSPSVLRAGASKALQRLRAIAARWRRPVVLLEVGYAPCSQAAVKPWEEERSGPPDLDAQRACYEALVGALERCDWVGGMFWWKWFTSERIGGPADASFTPQGKPAEAVLRRAFGSWSGRVVRVPQS